MKTIKVTQNASGKFAPDTAVITIRPSAESKKYAEATEKLNAQAENIIVKLNDEAMLKKSEVQKSGTSVMQVRRDGKTVFAANTEIRTALSPTDARVGDVIAVAEKSGAQYGSEYVLRDKSYKNALVAEAVNAARASADSIAKAAGVKLGALASVEYAASYGGGVRMMRAAIAADDAGADPESIEAVETVTCEWEIA